MADALWYVGTAGVGMLLGIASLPWSNKPGISKDGPLAWLAAWTFFWPFLLIFATWAGFKAYLLAWRGFSDRRQTTKHRDQHSYTLGEAIIKMRQTTKGTYFKRRQ